MKEFGDADMDYLWRMRQDILGRREDEQHEEPEEDISAQPKFSTQEELEHARRDFFFSDCSQVKGAGRENIKGMDLLLKQVDEYIFYMKNYDKLAALGARTSPGILLSGAPGMGKTLMARYIISQSGAKSIDACALPRMGGRWTREDIKALFVLAKEYVAKEGKPLVLFFDEFEVVAKERKYSGMSDADVAAALTTEIDGVGGKNGGIIIIATTNYPRDIDRALLRPGRIGHHIEFEMPTTEGREEILRYYCEKKPHEEIDYHSFSCLLLNANTPAAIEELVEKAYIRSCMENMDHVEDANVNERVLLRLVMDDLLGCPAEYRPDEQDIFRMAVYQAGKALVAGMLGLEVPLVIVPREGYEHGLTITETDDMMNEIVVSSSGDIACELCSIVLERRSDVTYPAFCLAADNVNGASMRCYGGIRGESPNFTPLSDSMRANVEQSTIEIIEKARERAREILIECGRERIERFARVLIEREFLVKRDVDEIFAEMKE